eukprot:Skav223388  [mRNA]  locus=scaffold2634:402611:404898:- [translate_table: standard]
MLGLAMVPYTPALCRAQKSVCFLDVACIHQTDKELMTRGIYGLGGFLRQSEELRVLWSPPYLSRLWCVFELAAYHAANPDGKVTMCPIFVEIGVVVMFVGAHLVSTLSEMIMVTEAFGSWIFVAYLVGLLPTYIIIHLLRKIIRKKRVMIYSLETFSLDQAECRNDFDREFIHNAIRAWYGSEGAFEDFVRQDLREELLRIGSTSIPLPYIGMVIVAVVSSTLDCVTALVRGGAPAEVVSTHFIGVGIGQSFFWFFASLNLILYFCDRWAFPLCNCDHATSALVFLAFFATFYGGSMVTREACEYSLWAAVGWCAFTMVVAAMVLLRRCSMESRRNADDASDVPRANLAKDLERQDI